MLCVSCFGWFLVISFSILEVYPDLWAGLAQILFWSLLPAGLAYTLNRKLLVKGPTILQAALANLLSFLFYTGLTIWSCYYLFRAGILSIPWFGSRSLAVFCSCWQLFCWGSGAYTAYLAGIGTEIRQVGMIALSLPAVPAVFILAVLGFPPALLLMLIAAWFCTLALSLATVGGVSGQHTGYRYDIIFLHWLSACLVAVLLFFAVFSREALQILLGAQKALLAGLEFLYRVLLWLLSLFPEQHQDPNFSEWQRPEIDIDKLIEKGGADPFWLKVLLILLTAAGFIFLAVQLLKLFKIRLAPAQRTSGVGSVSLLTVLRDFAALLLALGRGLLKIVLFLAVVLQKGLISLGRMLRKLIYNWLPSQTPDQAISRSYRSLLRWGCRAGYPRKAYETPLEYALRLEKAVEGRTCSGEEIHQLTVYYLETCYRRECNDWQRAEECRTLLAAVKRGYFI